jgi:hypothetical protein
LRAIVAGAMTLSALWFVDAADGKLPDRQRVMSRARGARKNSKTGATDVLLHPLEEL